MRLSDSRSLVPTVMRILERQTMRNAAGLILASVVSAVLIAGLWFWTSSRHADVSAAPQTVNAAQAERLPPVASAKHDDVEVTAAIPDKPPVSPPSKTACANPDALGVSRVVEIDTTGGPGFGFEHFKQLDFLADKEVVLTFDDGPWPGNTPAVLKALDDECTKAVFFQIGKHEIEKGDGAVKLALGAAPSPFFRFPELQHGPAAVAYLGTRNVAIFSCDLDSFDFRKNSSADKVVSTVMEKLNKLGKGIILMHDFQKHTADGLPELLRQL